MRLPDKDIATGLYKSEHAGITYFLPFELLNSLKDYYAARRGTIAGWYNDLPGEDRQKVRREGLPARQGEGDFYPDVEAD